MCPENTVCSILIAFILNKWILKAGAWCLFVQQLLQMGSRLTPSFRGLPAQIVCCHSDLPTDWGRPHKSLSPETVAPWTVSLMPQCFLNQLCPRNNQMPNPLRSSGLHLFPIAQLSSKENATELFGWENQRHQHWCSLSIPYFSHGCA